LRASRQLNDGSASGRGIRLKVDTGFESSGSYTTSYGEGNEIESLSSLSEGSRGRLLTFLTRSMPI
jgi:hypothetical protein